MPREAAPITPTTGSVFIPVADVDAPSVSYLRAKVTITGRQVVVADQKTTVLSTYEFDDDPFDGATGLWTGTVDGAPLIIRSSKQCGCGGTKETPK